MKPKGTLYCVIYSAFEFSALLGRADWIPQKPEYLHAETAGEARVRFLAGWPGRRITIIGIAPVVGFKVLDEKRHIVSV